MGPQGIHLRPEGVGDVDVPVGARVGEDPDLEHGPGLEPLGRQFGVSVGVAGVGVDRLEGGLAGGQVVGMTGEDPVPAPLRGLAEDDLGPHLADDPGERGPQRDPDLQATVREAQEPDVVDTHGGRCGPLLGLAQGGGTVPTDVVGHLAGVAVGHDGVGHRAAGRRQAGHGARGAEVDVVGVGADDQGAGRDPGLGPLRLEDGDHPEQRRDQQAAGVKVIEVGVERQVPAVAMTR